MEPSYVATNASVSAICVALYVCYNVWFFFVIKKHPEKTVFGLTSSARRVWVASIMYRKDSILAVQSLRNWIMAASILASTSIAIVFGFIAFLTTIGSHSDTTSSSNPLSGAFGFVLDELFAFKILIIIVDFMFAFSAFAQAMRFFNHVGLIVNVNLTDAERANLRLNGEVSAEKVTPYVVGEMLNRGCLYNTIGLRAYYTSFPLIAYLWGPWALLGATLLLLLLLRILDFNLDRIETGRDRASERDRKKTDGVDLSAVNARSGNACSSNNAVTEIVVAP